VKTKHRLHAIQWGIIALVPLLFTILTIYSCSPKQSQANLNVINHGERSMGTIISTEDFLGYEEGEEFTVEYNFTSSSGQQLSGHYLFPQSDSSDFNVGDRLEIAYDSNNLSKNLPVSGKERESAYRGRVWAGIYRCDSDTWRLDILFWIPGLGSVEAPEI
jgi:hypothetical protein